MLVEALCTVLPEGPHHHTEAQHYRCMPMSRPGERAPEPGGMLVKKRKEFVADFCCCCQHLCALSFYESRLRALPKTRSSPVLRPFHGRGPLLQGTTGRPPSIKAAGEKCRRCVLLSPPIGTQVERNISPKQQGHDG